MIIPDGENHRYVVTHTVDGGLDIGYQFRTKLDGHKTWYDDQDAGIALTETQAIELLSVLQCIYCGKVTP